MRAAVVREFGAPLVIEERLVPEPGPGEVVIRMEASGLCHTDIHAAHGDWPVKPTPPFVPGHEGVGIVHAAGEGVAAPQIGQRVAVPWLGYACGTCEHCLTGWETLCLSQQNLHRAGRTRVVSETRPLEAVNESIGEVLRGQARARIVLQP